MISGPQFWLRGGAMIGEQCRRPGYGLALDAVPVGRIVHTSRIRHGRQHGLPSAVSHSMLIVARDFGKMSGIETPKSLHRSTATQYWDVLGRLTSHSDVIEVCVQSSSHWSLVRGSNGMMAYKYSWRLFAFSKSAASSVSPASLVFTRQISMARLKGPWRCSHSKPAALTQQR